MVCNMHCAKRSLPLKRGFGGQILCLPYKATTLTHILLYIKMQIKANKNASFFMIFSVNFLKRRNFLPWKASVCLIF